MSVGPLIVEILCVFALSSYLLHKYGDWKKQHPLVTLTVFISWYFSFIIIFVLPLDVTTTYYRQCVNEHGPISIVTPPTPTHMKQNTQPAVVHHTQNFKMDISTEYVTEMNSSHRERRSVEQCQKPWSYVPENILPTIWSIVYWTSYLLTWVVMPIMKSYVCAGEFTVRGKIKAALIENAIWYGSYLLIFGVFLIYVAINPAIDLDGQKLQVIGITASNTWGLLLLVLLLGYGLVEVPRRYWHQSRKGYLLKHVYFQLAKLSTEKSEAEEHLEDILEDTKRASDNVRYNHPLRKHVNTIIKKCPDEFQDSLVKHLDDYQDFDQRNPEPDPASIPTEKELVNLHSMVIAAMQTKKRTDCQWDNLVSKAFELEDVQNNEANHSKNYQHTYDPNYTGLRSYICTPNVEWRWRILVTPTLLKVTSVILVLFSFTVIWSEMTFFSINPTLSLFAIFVSAANTNYLLIEILCIIIVAYLSMCCYYTVFKIRIFDFYYLAPHHQTDESSLIFCGMMLCRLTPPLCLNFLSLIHLDAHVTGQSNLTETSYTEIMGRHLDVLPFIQSYFNVYYPIIVAVLCLATYLHLGSRCLSCLGFQQFVGDEEMTGDMIEEGLQLMKREKRKRERAVNSENRKRIIQEKFTSRENGRSSRFSNANNSNRDDWRKNRGNSASKAKYMKEDSAGDQRVEIFRDDEPVDYTEERASRLVDDLSDYSSMSANGGGSSDSGFGRQYGRQSKPKGIFDDV